MFHSFQIYANTPSQSSVSYWGCAPETNMFLPHVQGTSTVSVLSWHQQHYGEGWQSNRVLLGQELQDERHPHKCNPDAGIADGWVGRRAWVIFSFSQSSSSSLSFSGGPNVGCVCLHAEYGSNTILSTQLDQWKKIFSFVDSNNLFVIFFIIHVFSAKTACIHSLCAKSTVHHVPRASAAHLLLKALFLQKK